MCQTCYYIVQSSVPGLRAVWDDTVGQAAVEEVALPSQLEAGSGELLAVEQMQADEEKQPQVPVPPEVRVQLETLVKEYARRLALTQEPVLFTAGGTALQTSLMGALGAGLRKGELERRNIDMLERANNQPSTTQFQ